MAKVSEVRYYAWSSKSSLMKLKRVDLNLGEKVFSQLAHLQLFVT